MQLIPCLRGEGLAHGCEQAEGKELRFGEGRIAMVRRLER